MTGAANGSGAVSDQNWFEFRLRLLSAFIVVAVWCLVAFQVVRERRSDLAQDEVELSNLTRAFAEHTAKTLEGADQAIRFVRREYILRRGALDLPSYINDGSVIKKDYNQISIIGPDGFVAASSLPFSRVDLHERAHFKVHRDGSRDDMFISEPVIGRVSGMPSIQLTRRIDLPDGSFGGVVVVSLASSYLTAIYGAVNLGQRGIVALAGYDGVIRARIERGKLGYGQDISGSALLADARHGGSGTMRLRSRVDGVERLVAYAALPEYKLIVMTGRSVDETLQETARRAMLYVAVAAIFTLAVIGFTVGLLRRARSQVALIGKLRESEIRASAASRMKTQLLASVSHELRTPLNGILGYAELIQITSGEPEAREFGGVILESARHLLALVNQLLDLAKIEAGKMTVARVPLAPADLIEEVRRTNAAAVHARGLELTASVEATCPLEVASDRTRLLQILNNLVGNSIKFTERGEISVTARGAGDGWEIQVRDTGIGIPAAMLPRLFERFQALSNDFVHPGQGAGIGLPLTRELTSLLGGTIEIESEPGRGTVATIRLPCRRGPVERPYPGTPTTQPSTGSIALGRP